MSEWPLCDLGDPGWEDPWFPHSAVLLHSLGDVFLVFSVFSFVLFSATPIPELIQCHPSPSSIVSELDRRSLFMLLFLVCFVWFLCCFLLLVVLPGFLLVLNGS